jgi:acyl dehydratase
MTTNAEQAYESMKATEGQPEGTGEWFEVTQDLINTFADATHDHQFIHVDPERAKASPFGGTIAHGFLTLSLLTHLIGSIRPDEGAAPRPAPRMEGMLMGVNYGFDKVRFVSPVKSGSKIRAKAVTKAVELKGNAINTTRTITVEIEGEDKPALVADWITRLVFS